MLILGDLLGLDGARVSMCLSLSHTCLCSLALFTTKPTRVFGSVVFVVALAGLDAVTGRLDIH